MTRQSYETHDDASLESLVTRYCRVPDPLTSAEELERLRHADLDGRSRASLLSELETLRLWLRVQGPQHLWFHERVQRLREVVRSAC